MPALPPSRARRTVLGAACSLALATGALALASPAPAVAPSAAHAYASAAAPAYVSAAARSKATKPAVRPGMTNKRIKRLQRLLGVKPASGWYGPLTRAAVREFKSSHGLGRSAVFGAKAWRKLLREKGLRGSDRTRPASRSTARSGLVCPAPRARFSNDYGDPRSGHSHAGIDMLGARGMPLYAVENGYVVRAGKQSNGANRIVIKGTQTGAKYYYGHNSRHLVSNGQRFKAGDVIALMGDSGSPGINHLHFEWWKSGGESDQVNPYDLLRRIC